MKSCKTKKYDYEITIIQRIERIHLLNKKIEYFQKDNLTTYIDKEKNSGQCKKKKPHNKMKTNKQSIKH